MSSSNQTPDRPGQPSRETIAVLMNKQKEAAEMLKKHIEEDLSDQDRAALKKASQKFMTHASMGLWIGTALGCAFVFRGRFRSPRNLPASFYPSIAKNVVKADATAAAGEGAASRSKGASLNDPMRDKMAFIMKGLGWGTLGAFVGTQVGMVSGASAAQKVMDTEGTGAVEKMKWAVDKVAADLKALDEVGKSGGNRSSSAVSGDPDAPQSEGYYRRETVDDQSNDDSSAGGIGSSPQVATRWDELRKKSASPPSSWDTIREQNAKQNLSKSSAGGRNSSSSSSQSSSVEEPYVETDRDAQRREFEKLMDKERGGGDDEARDSRWKGNN